MKQLSALIALVSLAVSATAAPRPGSGSSRRSGGDRPHPAVVRVIVSEGQGLSLGSGTLVDVTGRHGLIVTNWHVVRDARGPINVVFPDGFRSGASVLATNADWDLAALAIWRPKVDPVRLAQQAPRIDDPLTIAGYGSGQYRSASGQCVQYISPGSSHPFEMLELSTAARDGDSGGPIFNNRGELAGVLFGASRGRTAGSYCGRVQWFLDSVSTRLDSLADPTDTMIAQAEPVPRHSALPIDPATAVTAAPTPVLPSEPAWRASDQAAGAPRAQRPMPLASIPAPIAGPPAAAALAPNQMAEGGPAAVSSTSPVAMDPTPLSLESVSGPAPFGTAVLGGNSMLEQIKNFLAIFGLVAITFQVMRIFGSLQIKQRPARRRRRAPQRRPTRRRIIHRYP